MPWQRPGFDLGLKVGAAASDPARAGLVLGSHGLITWGETSQACYDATLRVIQQAADWLDANSKAEPFGPIAVAPLPPAERRACRSTGRARAARHAESARQQGDALGRFRRRAGVRRQRPLRGAGRARHHLSGSLSAHENPAALRAVRSAERTAGGSDRAAAGRSWSNIATSTGRTTSDASGATRRRCAIRIRCCSSFPGSGLLAFQKDKATARVATEYLRQHDQRHALGRGRRRSTCRRRSRKRSTSNTGRSRKRSCSGCRQPQGSRAGSRWSPAAPAASEARHRAPAARRRRVLSCCADLDQAALDGAVADAEAAHGPDRVRGVLGDVTERGLGVARRSPDGGARVRRPRHPRVERRHRVRLADRRDLLATGSATSTSSPPAISSSRGTAFALMKAAGARRVDRVRGQQERAGRVSGRVGLLHRQGGRAAPRALPRCGRRGARHSRERRQSGRRDSRVAHLERRRGGRSARPATASPKMRSRSSTASAACSSEACCPRTSRRRSYSSPRTLRQVDRQHPERRRRQRDGVHALTEDAHGVRADIATPHRPRQRTRLRALEEDYDAPRPPARAPRRRHRAR